MKRHAVIIGGQHTGAEKLWDVAEAAVEVDWADDAEVFTLPQGMRYPDRLARHIRRGRVIQHSFASWPVRRAVGLDVRPELVIDCCGVEPMSYAQMIQRAVRKHRMARDPGAAPELREIVRHNLAQAVRHPIGNTRYLPHLTRYSTFDSLAEYGDMGIPVLAVRYLGDIMVPYEDALKPPNVDVLLRPGAHDQILIHPQEEMQAIAAELGR